MITLKLPITVSQEDGNFIHDLQRQQSPMIRAAFVQAKRELPEIEVRSVLRTRFAEQLDSWFVQSAVKLGIGMALADRELGVKTRIFGGRKNFIRRAKGLISNNEWRELRIQPLYLIGQAPVGGNRKFEFGEDSVVFKPWRGKRILLELPPLRRNYQRLWRAAVQLAGEDQLPITVSLTSTHICLSFDETKVVKEPEKKVIKNRIAGIDMNPNEIGVSVFDGEKLIETKLFSMKQLTGKNISADKLLHETREVAHAVGRWLTELQVDKVFVEQLSFKPGDKGRGRNFNRLCINQWPRAAFRAALMKHHKLYPINAAYTSTIGNVLNPTLPDPIAASMAVAQRGYHLLVLRNKQYFPALPSHTYLKDLWKETVVPEVKDWVELHAWVKNSKLKYRVPVPSEWVFRKMSSWKSCVTHISHKMS